MNNFSITAQSGERVFIMWDPPSNRENFNLRYYCLSLECDGSEPTFKATSKTSYRYENRFNPGVCTATVEVMNSCGSFSSNSISFIHTGG